MPLIAIASGVDKKSNRRHQEQSTPNNRPEIADGWVVIGSAAFFFAEQPA